MRCLTDILVENIYKISANKIRSIYRLDAEPPNWFNTAEKQIIFGCSRDLIQDQITTPSIVIGGPCLSYTNGDYNSILIKDCIDIMMPIKVAYSLDLPCLLIFEANQLNNFNPSENWKLLIDIVTYYAQSYAELIGFDTQKLFIFNSMMKTQSDVLKLLQKKYKDIIMENELYGLYSIDFQTNHPKGHIYEKELLQSYNNTLITYLPEFIARIVKKPISKVIVAENVNQLRAIQYVDIISNKICCTSPSVISYIAAPNTNGLRMDIGNSKKKLFANENPQKIINRLQRSSEVVKKYYSYFSCDESINDDLNKTTHFIQNVSRIYHTAVRNFVAINKTI